MMCDNGRQNGIDLQSFIIEENATIYDAIAAIDRGGKQIVFVCEGQKLRAAISDGDIRRFILRAGDPSQPVSLAANYNPLSLMSGEAYRAQELMKAQHLRAMPIINARGEIISIEFADNIIVRRPIHLGIPVVIMAGGRGTRLAPYTDVLPKPLIPVGDKTITEHIIAQFLSFGCDDFTMIVNYKKSLIKAYFKESSYKGAFRFVDEPTFQGTGGGLKLLDGHMDGTFFMTNCDVLVDADYEDILKYHKEIGAVITMVCALKKVSVPYGTVEMNRDGKPVQIIEKPEYPLLTNTGLYVIEPAFLETIPAGAFVHITELIQQRIDAGDAVGVYPIGEHGWMDMGQAEELERMRRRVAGNVL